MFVWFFSVPRVGVGVHVQRPSDTMFPSGFVHRRRLVQRAVIGFLRETAIAVRLSDGLRP